MISLQTLYDNFTSITTEELKGMIRSELSRQIGVGFDGCCQRLERCFEQTEHYTNQCQKSGKPNSDGIFTRRSGEPYINHTLRVALILIREKVTDFDVIIAAIMHDLFEDTSYTYEMAEREFGSVVADLINCVTNVSEEQRNMETAAAEVENIDYANIIKRCSSRKIAFYIKFADRLDNLLTIAAMPRDKQLKKVSDTKKYLLPLMELLGAKRFKTYIENAIFKVESALAKNGVNEYAILRKSIENSNALQSTSNAVTALRNYFCTSQRMAHDCRIVYPLPYEVKLQLANSGLGVQQFKQSRLLYPLFLLVEGGMQSVGLKTIASAILSASELEMLAVESVTDDGINLVDDIQNHYLLKVMSPVDFNIMQYGSTESSIPIVEAFTIEDELTPDKVLVYNATDNELKRLPRGSTITDFAFSLGDEVGLFLAGARINGNLTTDYSIELNDGDTVEVFTTDSRNLYTIKVSWLLHCKTARAKHSLCIHLQNQIDRLIERINKYEK